MSMDQSGSFSGTSSALDLNSPILTPHPSVSSSPSSDGKSTDDFPIPRPDFSLVTASSCSESVSNFTSQDEQDATTRGNVFTFLSSHITFLYVSVKNHVNSKLVCAAIMLQLLKVQKILSGLDSN